jgi:hypothetical protein
MTRPLITYSESLLFYFLIAACWTNKMCVCVYVCEGGSNLTWKFSLFLISDDVE